MASMTATEMQGYVGKTISIYDARTGTIYSSKIRDARTSWGKLQIQLENSSRWFEPGNKEIESLEQEWFN